MNEIIIKLIELMLSVFGVGINNIPFIFLCILILFFILLVSISKIKFVKKNKYLKFLTRIGYGLNLLLIVSFFILYIVYRDSFVYKINLAYANMCNDLQAYYDLEEYCDNKNINKDELYYLIANELVNQNKDYDSAITYLNSITGEEFDKEKLELLIECYTKDDSKSFDFMKSEFELLFNDYPLSEKGIKCYLNYQFENSINNFNDLLNNEQLIYFMNKIEDDNYDYLEIFLDYYFNNRVKILNMNYDKFISLIEKSINKSSKIKYYYAVNIIEDTEDKIKYLKEVALDGDCNLKEKSITHLTKYYNEMILNGEELFIDDINFLDDQCKNANNNDICYLLGDNFKMKNDYDQSISYYKITTYSDSNAKGAGFYQIAKQYLENQQYDDAYLNFLEAAKLDYNIAKYYLGYLYVTDNLSMYFDENTIKDYCYYFKLDYTCSGQVNIQLYKSLDEYLGALASKYIINNDEAKIIYARYLFELDNNHEYIVELLESVKNPTAYSNLLYADLLYENQNYEKAKKVLNENYDLLKNYDNLESNYDFMYTLLGLIKINLNYFGNLGNVSNYYELFNEIYPGNIELTANRAESYFYYLYLTKNYDLLIELISENSIYQDIFDTCSAYSINVFKMNRLIDNSVVEVNSKSFMNYSKDQQYLFLDNLFKGTKYINGEVINNSIWYSAKIDENLYSYILINRYNNIYSFKG